MVKNIEHEEEDETVDDEVDDLLTTFLYKASTSCDRYYQAVRELEKKEDVNWKDVPTGAY